MLVALYQDSGHGTFTSQSERGSTVVVGVAATSKRDSTREPEAFLGFSPFVTSEEAKTATVQALGTNSQPKRQEWFQLSVLQEKDAKCSCCG